MGEINEYKFWSENLKGRELRRIETYMYLRKIGWEGVYRTYLAHGRDQRRDLVNMVMNLRFPQNTGYLLTS
jgi:hypothetical protein